MLMVRCRLAFLAVLMLTLLVAGASVVFASEQDDARSVILGAEGKVVDCYEAVLDAEKAGANVTGLLIRLNEAGEILSKANLAYSVGNYSLAIELAGQSTARLDSFVADADTLMDAAAQEHYWDFMINVVGSSVGTVAVVCGSFFAWRFLKKYERVGSVVS